MEKINTLVLSGGGVKSAAYIGALNSLFSHIPREQIIHYVGTSSGGIFAILLAIGYSCTELQKILMKYDFKQFLNDINYDDIVCNYGISEGEQMTRFCTELLDVKNCNITFAELYDKVKIKTTITVTNFTAQHVEYWNHETTPNNSVLAAMIATSRVPIFFTPFQYNNNLYLDGGIINNYPINYVENELDTTLGFCLMSNRNTDDIKNLVNYMMYVFILTCNSNIILLNQNYTKKTIFINIDEISFIDFEIDDEQKLNMVETGARITEKYIKDTFP